MLRRLLASSLTLLVISACADTGPSAPAAVQVAGSAASASSCQSVRFTWVGAPVAGLTFAGPLSGDLQGTLSIEFDPASFAAAGVTFKNAGTADWSLSGGVEGLSAFRTTFDNMNIETDRPGSPAWLFENTGRHRALSGVAKANLTYRGEFAAVPSPVVTLHWHGVICP